MRLVAREMRPTRDFEHFLQINELFCHVFLMKLQRKFPIFLLKFHIGFFSLNNRFSQKNSWCLSVYHRRALDVCTTKIMLFHQNSLIDFFKRLKSRFEKKTNVLKSKIRQTLNEFYRKCFNFCYLLLNSSSNCAIKREWSGAI